MLEATENAHFWNRAARKYARDPIKDLAGYERTLARTREVLGRGDAVLEIGCGTGTTALRLAPHVARLVATDVASEMIGIAQEKAVAEGATNLDFAVASAGQLPGEDGTFDAVLAYNVCHLIEDQRAALAEVHRVLKPDGLFISKTPCLDEMNPLIRLAVPVMRLIGKAPHVAFFNAAALEREIAGAGFTIVERARHGSGRKDARVFIIARKANLEPNGTART